MLDDRAPSAPSRKRSRYIYFPGHAPSPGGVAVNVRGRSYKILADVEITDPDAQGVIFAHGSRFGGHALFIKDQQAALRLQLPRHPARAALRLNRDRDRQAHARHGVHPKEAGEHGEPLGTTKLYVDDEVVAEGPMRTQAGKFTLSGDGLCVGRDSGDAVSKEYKTPGTFSGGTIEVVGVTVKRPSTWTWRRKPNG